MLQEGLGHGAEERHGTFIFFPYQKPENPFSSDLGKTEHTMTL